MFAAEKAMHSHFQSKLVPGPNKEIFSIQPVEAVEEGHNVLKPWVKTTQYQANDEKAASSESKSTSTKPKETNATSSESTSTSTKPKETRATPKAVQPEKKKRPVRYYDELDNPESQWSAELQWRYQYGRFVESDIAEAEYAKKFSADCAFLRRSCNGRQECNRYVDNVFKDLLQKNQGQKRLKMYLYEFVWWTKNTHFSGGPQDELETRLKGLRLLEAGQRPLLVPGACELPYERLRDKEPFKESPSNSKLAQIPKRSEPLKPKPTHSKPSTNESQSQDETSWLGWLIAFAVMCLLTHWGMPGGLF